MIKSGKPQFIVDSVDKAIKFYTEKLSFDLIDLSTKKENGNEVINYALLKKGKCFVIFRTPSVGELADMSMIKHCSNRGSGLFIELKKDIEKYIDRFVRRGVNVIDQPKKNEAGVVAFSIKDPFGFKIVFVQAPDDFALLSKEFGGMGHMEKPTTLDAEKTKIDNMIAYLKDFGLQRRVAKKYTRLWLKRTLGLSK